MLLVKCPSCGRSISDEAAACPGCGYPIAAKDKSRGCFVIIILVLIYMIGSYTCKQFKENPQRTRPTYPSYEQPESPPLKGSDQISTYRAASYAQQMAICEALAKTAQRQNHQVSALDIYTCIDKATTNVNAGNLTVAEVAASCIVLMENM